MQLSNILRTVLRIDATSCLAMAALVIPTVGMIEGPLGIDRAVLTAAGISLLPIGLFILWLGSRREAWPGLVYLVVVGNIGWALSSFALTLSTPGITAIGTLAVVGQGAFVLLLALIEWRLVRAEARCAAAS